MQLVLIRGLPGSGKSTMAKALAKSGFKHFEADTYHLNDEGDYCFDQANAKALGVEPNVLEAKGSWQNVHAVPAEVMDQMRARWEPLSNVQIEAPSRPLAKVASNAGLGVAVPPAPTFGEK